ncbi:MAG TPA: histidine ammonia-lyase [Myxococcales bacterium]|nr:histidine ammonia-lyase [Myxococcales bacterium]
MTDALALDGNSLTLADLSRVAEATVAVTLADDARDKVQAARALVDRLAASPAPTYGINTGFGTLAEVAIAPADLAALQRNLILSHAAGVGEPLPLGETRALMALRANVLAKGYSGVRVETLQLLLAALNAGVTPVVPERGSVGASGDLAPLAHLALLLIGEGEAIVAGRRMPAREALRHAKLAPVVLQAKEGLALVNGTQAICAVGGLALQRAKRLSAVAHVAGAATVEGLLGSHRPFEARLHSLRPHAGQDLVAMELRGLLADSPLNASHQTTCTKVQDAYSLRCMPQVHGAAVDALAFAGETFATELNAATDNPLVFAETSEIVSGGNFHGQPVAQAADMIAIALAQLGAISERRIEQLVNPALSGLPPFLAPKSGLHSGFMIAQVTAAALVAELRLLAHPACIDSIPTSAGREDHVSMGMGAALKARTACERVRAILAIELLCACQALDLRKPLVPARKVAQVHAAVRARVPPMFEDRELHRDIAAVCALIDEGAIERAVGAGN